jgi:septal ring factor EnvC (AmiA/AmiB activator)
MASLEIKTLITLLAVLAKVLIYSVISMPAMAAQEKVDAGKHLEEVQRKLSEAKVNARKLKKKTDEVEKDLARLRHDMVVAAKTIQSKEFQTSELIKKLSALEIEENNKSARLNASRGSMIGVLEALQRFTRYPPEALLMQPTSPADTVRSAILLRAIVPEIDRQALSLRQDLESVKKARSNIAIKQAKLIDLTVILEKKRKDLTKLFGKKTAFKHRTMAKRRKESRRLNSLVKEASSISDLLEKINRAKLKPISRPAFLDMPSVLNKSTQDNYSPSPTVKGLPSELTGKPISSQRGKLPTPVIGRIVGKFGQALRTGLTRKGMKLQTTPGAQVVALYEGRIVYAGKFRGYGELLIMEHGEGYHSLLSGLSRIDGTMGQWVISGEPVGVMGRSNRRNPILYVEFRRNGQPINPLPWLSARK